MKIVVVGHGWENALGLGKKYFPSVIPKHIRFDHYFIRVTDKMILVKELRSLFAYVNEASSTSTGNFSWNFLESPDELSSELSTPAVTNSSAILFPIYDESLLGLKYSGIDRLEVGGSVDTSIIFGNPILSEFGESLSWQRNLAHYNYEKQTEWVICQYRLVGYEDGYHPLARTKILILDSNTIKEETDWGARLFPIYRNKLYGGDTYKRVLIDSDTVAEVFCYSHEYEYNGTLYAVTEDNADVDNPAITFTPLYASPAGGTANISGVATPDCRRINRCLDVFSSPEADHYYLIRQTADNVLYNDAYPTAPMPRDPGYIVLFSGCSLVVEKRKKTDWSLVVTYNINPAGLDWTQQGITTAQQVMCVENSAYAYGVQPALTNNSLSKMFSVVGGVVLVSVDSEGIKTEYPLLPVVNCLQDYLEVSGINGIVEEVDKYRSGTVGTTNLRRNLFHQTALLWLGGSHLDYHTWAGVDGCAIPLKDGSIGIMRDWEVCLADSDSALLQANPHRGLFSSVFFDNMPENNKKSTHLYIKLTDATDCYTNSLTLGEAYYDLKFILEVNGVTTIFSTIDRLETDNIDAAELKFLTFLTESGLTATVAIPHDANGYTKYAISSSEDMNLNISYKSDEYGSSSMQKVLKVVLENGTPIISLKAEQSIDRVLKLQEI